MPDKTMHIRAASSNSSIVLLAGRYLLARG